MSRFNVESLKIKSQRKNNCLQSRLLGVISTKTCSAESLPILWQCTVRIAGPTNSVVVSTIWV